MLAALHGNPLRLGNLGAPPRRLRGLQGLRAASVDKPNKKPSMRVVQELENSLKRMVRRRWRRRCQPSPLACLHDRTPQDAAACNFPWV